MTKRNCCVFSFLLIFAASSVVGCKDKMGGTFPMSIKVSMNGSPVEGAMVMLFEDGGKGHTATGVTNASGLAVVKSTEGWGGVFPGEYSVSIKKTENTTSSTPPPGTEVDRTYGGDDNVYTVSRELLPVKYGNAKTSELKVTQDKKKGYAEFDLKENP